MDTLDIMQMWSQIREEFIRFEEKSFIHVDDLDDIMKLSKEYIYHSPLEDTFNNMFVFDPDGRIGFSEIMKGLKENGMYESGNKIGRILKSLAPKDQNIKIKTSDGIRYYKLNWRSAADTQDLPF